MGNALTLSSNSNIVQKLQLVRVVQEAVRQQQSETGYPQTIILSGCSGPGKIYASVLFLRQLFDLAGGGPESSTARFHRPPLAGQRQNAGQLGAVSYVQSIQQYAP